MFRRRKTDQAPGEGGPQDLDRYRRAWHSYVARRNLVVVLFLSFIFLGFMIGKLKLGEPADFGIMLLWIGVYLAGGWWLTEWRGPPPRERFAHPLCAAPRLSLHLAAELRDG